MNQNELEFTLQSLSAQTQSITAQLQTLLQQAQVQAADTAATVANVVPAAMHDTFFVDALTVLVLAGFVGYYVIWNVTPALHAPLMGITNAISSVIILGALLATGAAATGLVHGLGFVAIVLASINIFGGFLVTYRMLDMFKAKAKKPQ